eukprot:gnl/MRDRNA2_/MRDRNA2_59106_c0_seq1.p1 gnl/MRDRNA2_/MRDRNA2_59106_c0~~gnl/MRDRNA2_/MRDRNA2_59106_c0_seq1.p1  ORF type:complete len:718 (-),score=126.31 gnl/MRDRNA2_/MRDRNA2_59106_c0_seq1:277-2352(-)
MCPGGPTIHQQHAAAVRQAGLATLKATKNACSTPFASSMGVMSSDDLVCAAASLYDDEIQPLSRILKRRLVELSGDATLRAADIDLGALRVAVSAAAPRLTAQQVEGGDWEAVLSHRPPSFVDVHSPCDRYGEEMWQAFIAYISTMHSPSEYHLPSSRYACAFELRARNLPFFAGLSLGSLCHIVQLAISQKKILGHRDGSLVPYTMSKCFEKEKHAVLGVAQVVSPNSEAANLPFADWAAVRACLMEIMSLARHSEHGCEPLANIKRLFRSRYHLELSETLLGYTKLSEVLQDPQVSDLCILQMRNSGCSVVPTPLWGAPPIENNDFFDRAAVIEPQAMWDVSPFGESSSRSNELFGLNVESEAAMQHMQGQHESMKQTGTESIDSFDGLMLDLDLEDSMSPSIPLPLSPSKLCEGGTIRSIVKNTFIEHPDESTRQRESARRRSSSVPRNFGSAKDDWETACHMLSYQHRSVQPSNAMSSVSTRKVIVQRHGCGLGLDVSCEEESGLEFLLIEDVGPGPIELWNLSHPGDAMVQTGDRILEVNGVSGDANAMLQAVQASDTVELTLECCPYDAKREAAPSSPAPTACWDNPALSTTWPQLQPFGASASQMCPCPELAMSCQAPLSTSLMQMVPGSIPQMQMMPPQMQTPACPVQAPPCGGKVFIHSGPPKVFVHSGPPVNLLREGMVLG